MLACLPLAGRQIYSRCRGAEPMQTISLDGRSIGPGFPTFVVAEVAQAHDGSLGMAHAYIDAVADVGADAVKFQTHIASAESTLDEPFRVAFSTQDMSRYHYWRRMEFSDAQWSELAAHTHDRGLAFLSSPFSVEAVRLLQPLGLQAWKIGSGELWSKDLLEAVSETGLPVILSTDLATWDDIRETVYWCKAQGLLYGLMQCTTAYPTPFSELGLNVIDELREEFDCPVGLSDHSGSMFSGLAAIARGADILEVHVTFHRGMFGPDVASSVTVEELKTLCEMRDAVTVLDAHPVDKTVLRPEMELLRAKFGKSLALVKAFPAGTILARDMLTTKKPATGIPLAEIESVLGQRLVRDVMPDRLLRRDDLEDLQR